MTQGKHPEAIKLYENIKKYSSPEIAEKLAFGVNLPIFPSKEECKTWVTHIVSELENEFDDSKIKKIRMGCYCDEDGKLEENKQWLKNIYSASRTIEEFVDTVNEHAGGWYIQDGMLYTKYFHCGCPMVEGIDRLNTNTWCYCTVGFAKEIFDQVLGYEVEIDVSETMKSGSDYCLIRVSKKNGDPIS